MFSRMLCVLFTVFCLLVSAEEPNPPKATPEQEQRIKALILQLNAPDNIKREDAADALLKIGPTALPYLKQALNAPELEIAAKAKTLVQKLEQTATMPKGSLAAVLPADAMFFAELLDIRKSLAKYHESPLGKAWRLDSTQKWFKAHYDDQGPNDQKIFDVWQEVPKLLEGRVAMMIGGGESISDADFDPAVIYHFESKQMAALEAQIRKFLEAANEAPKNKRQVGPFIVETGNSHESVFGQESIIHALTENAMNKFLESLTTRPQKSLLPIVEELRAQMPDNDGIFYFSTEHLQKMADGIVLVDQDQVQVIDILGLGKGTSFGEVFRFNGDGVEELATLKLPKDGNKQSLANVLMRMAADIPAAPAGGAPQALDLMPSVHALLTFNGNIAKNAADIAEALRALDGREPLPLVPQQQPAAAAPGPNANGNENPNDKTLKPQARDIVENGLKTAAGNIGDKKPDAPPAAGGRKCDHVERIEKMGLKFEQLLEQIEGPLQLGFVLDIIENDSPDTIPVTPIFAMMLKDPSVVKKALDAASAGAAPKFKAQEMQGGTHYIEIEGDDDQKPGFWLKDKYFAYASHHEVLALVPQALAHANKNERITDRPSYKAFLANPKRDPKALFTMFAMADHVLEMPYNLARVNLQDDLNPWPDYTKEIKPLLLGKPMLLQFSHTPDGLKIYSQTPTSLFGLIELFRRPFIEAMYF